MCARGGGTSGTPGAPRGHSGGIWPHPSGSAASPRPQGWGHPWGPWGRWGQAFPVTASKIDRKWGHMALHRVEAAEVDNLGWSWVDCASKHIFVAKTANFEAHFRRENCQNRVTGGKKWPEGWGSASSNCQNAARGVGIRTRRLCPTLGLWRRIPRGARGPPPLGLLLCVHGWPVLCKPFSSHMPKSKRIASTWGNAER